MMVLSHYIIRRIKFIYKKNLQKKRLLNLKKTIDWHRRSANQRKNGG